MAWITKNSAGARVERRAEPYLTDAMKADLARNVLPRYERVQGALLPALHMIQHEYGWIPLQAMEEIAEFFTRHAGSSPPIRPADVIDCASFYEEYWLRPRGERLVAVCRSIACEFCGQPAVTQACRDHLGIDVGETTDDGKFTLIELECLGSCGTAPAVLIDETLHENVTPETIGQILHRAATEPGHPHH